MLLDQTDRMNPGLKGQDALFDQSGSKILIRDWFRDIFKADKHCFGTKILNIQMKRNKTY